MQGFVCVLVCLAALAAQTQGQGGQPGQPGQPGGQPGQPGGQPGQPGRQPGQPGGTPGQPGQPGGQPGQPGQPGGQPGLPGGTPGFPAWQPRQPGGQPGGQPDIRPSAISCPDLWIHHKGSCYRMESGASSQMRFGATGPTVFGYNEGLTQASANMRCGQLLPGASLVTVNSMEENNFLYKWVIGMLGHQARPVWIGLHIGANGLAQWYSGETSTYTNWEEIPEPFDGATMFDVQPNNQFNNQVDLTAQWNREDPFNERMFICEHRPRGMGAPPTTLPGSTMRPALLKNNRNNLMGVLRGAFGGSRLQEVRRGPASYRMNPYFAVRP